MTLENQEILVDRRIVILKDTEEINDSSEELPDYSGAVFTSKSGLDISKAAIFLGMTSGSFLIGFSIGWYIAGRENQSWLSKAVSSIVAKKVWKSMNIVIITAGDQHLQVLDQEGRGGI